MTLRPAAGGKAASLKLLQGAVPAHLLAGPRDLVTVTDLPRAGDKTFSGVDGIRLRLEEIGPHIGHTTLVRVALNGGPGWNYDADVDRFELTDARGRPYRIPVPTFLSPVFVPEPRPEDLAWLTVNPQAGFPGGLPWGAVALRRFGGLGLRPWVGGALRFVGDPGLGPPAKLILFRYRRTLAEVPFEFRDLPLP
jgi:hypothetical protein